MPSCHRDERRGADDGVARRRDARTSRTPSPVPRAAAGTTTADRISSSASAVVMMPVKKPSAAIDALALRADRDESRVERDEHGRQIGRRIGVRDVAADRAAVPDGRIADDRRRLGERGRRRAQIGGRGQLRMRRQRADADAVSAAARCRAAPGRGRCR